MALRAKKSEKQAYSELSHSELNKRLEEAKKELQDLRFKLVTSTVPNVRRIRHLKKQIARILTEQRQRELGINKSK